MTVKLKLLVASSLLRLPSSLDLWSTTLFSCPHMALAIRDPPVPRRGGGGGLCSRR